MPISISQVKTSRYSGSGQIILYFIYKWQMICMFRSSFLDNQHNLRFHLISFYPNAACAIHELVLSFMMPCTNISLI